MGTENPARQNFPTRPVGTPFAAPQTASPFSSSGPVVGSDATRFRPTSPAMPPNTMPFPSSSGPVVGSGAPGFRPMQPSRFPDPSLPPPPTSNLPATAGSFQRFPTPQFAPPTQVPPSQIPPTGQPPAAYGPPPPVSFHQQAQVTSVPMGSPPQSLGPPPQNVPQPLSDSSFPVARPNFQSSLPGYVQKQPNADLQSQQMQPPFVSHQGQYITPAPASPFLTHQGGYVPPPPAAASQGLLSTDQKQHPGTGPPLGSIQGLSEDFNSLSIGSIPGSIDAGIDPKLLPRPLNGDEEPKLFPEVYPMNCDQRYLRLTTSAIPSSQSLVSRWHLPLGAIVCPLAEAPSGVSVSVLKMTNILISVHTIITLLNFSHFPLGGSASYQFCFNWCDPLQEVSHLYKSICYIHRCWKKVALQHLFFVE